MGTVVQLAASSAQVDVTDPPFISTERLLELIDNSVSDIKNLIIKTESVYRDQTRPEEQERLNDLLTDITRIGQQCLDIKRHMTPKSGDGTMYPSLSDASRAANLRLGD